jgi:serine protease Do
MIVVRITLIAGSLIATLACAQTAPPSGAAQGSASAVAAVDGEAKKAATAEQSRTRVGLTVSALPLAQSKALGVEFGLRVETVDPAADITGKVNPGDVIVALNDEKFSSIAEFDALVARHKAGTTVALLVLRGTERVYVPVKVLGK